MFTPVKVIAPADMTKNTIVTTKVMRLADIASSNGRPFLYRMKTCAGPPPIWDGVMAPMAVLANAALMVVRREETPLSPLVNRYRESN